jgi:hypothetical protein
MRSIAKTHLPRFLTPASLLLQDFAASLDALARFSSAARAASAAAPSLATSAAPPAAGAPPGVIPPHMPPGMAEAHLALVEQVGVGVGVCVCVCVCVRRCGYACSRSLLGVHAISAYFVLAR